MVYVTNLLVVGSNPAPPTITGGSSVVRAPDYILEVSKPLGIKLNSKTKSSFLTHLENAWGDGDGLTMLLHYENNLHT